jgi:hypothetical protein
MKGMRTEQDRLGLVEAPSDKIWGNGNRRMEISPAPARDVYEVRPRKDGEGFDLISDRLRRGPIWYAGPDAVRNAVAYAKYHSHSWSHRPIIRVFDESGSAIETHEFAGDFRKWQADPKNYEGAIRFR